MVDTVVKKASLWRESWKAVKASVPSMWPSALVAAIILASLYFLVFHFGMSGAMLQMQVQLHDPRYLKLHPEAAGQYMHMLSQQFLWSMPLYAAISLSEYVFTVMYLRRAMKNNRPDYSVGGYFYWLGRVIWKYLHPILWLLIPLFGIIPYIRSTVRYALVSPLAVLRRGDELKTSWKLTQGNWWRIFGNGFLFVLILMLVAFIIALPLVILCGVAAVFTHQGISALTPVFSIIQGFAEGFGMLAVCIFSCTCYRVLSQEARQAAQAALPPAGNPASP